MENSDEAMERVLAGLRGAEAPAGMERRILEATRNGAAKRRQRSVAMPWRLAGWENWAIAVAGVIVVLSMVCWMTLREYRPGSANAILKRQMTAANPAQPPVQIADASTRQSLTERPVLRVREKRNARRARFCSRREVCTSARCGRRQLSRSGGSAHRAGEAATPARASSGPGRDGGAGSFVVGCARRGGEG
jgi:hypothetical protein